MAKRQAVRVQAAKRKNAIAPSVVRLTKVVEFLWKPRLIMSILAIAVVVMIQDWISTREIWPVESVKIEGEFNYLDKQKLREKALPSVNAGLLNVDLQQVRNSLIDLPWVEDVSVRRQWPDQILIRVIEKQPVVYWGENDLLSAKGKLFTPHKKLGITLPILFGPEGQHQLMLQELARMQAWLMDIGLYINRMSLDARRSWTLKMTDGMELRLGRQQMHERLDRFVSIYKDRLASDQRKIKHVDMRYTNGFAVAWKEA